jgi:hypothetical protein
VPILLDGNPGMVVALHAKLRLVLRLSFRDGRISEIETIAEPARLSQIELGVLQAMLIDIAPALTRIQWR